MVRPFLALAALLAAVLFGTAGVVYLQVQEPRLLLGAAALVAAGWALLFVLYLRVERVPTRALRRPPGMTR